MLQDSDRTKRAENFSPTDDEINIMLARGDNELELFRRLDNEVSWPGATVKSDLPQWIQYGEKELRSAAVDNAKHAIDIQSEIAALTGTVIHHHHAQPPAGAADNAAPAAAGTTKVRLRLPSKKKAAAMEESSMDFLDSQMDNGPTVTGTTNKSGREEDEVTVGNDEEEEVLDGNILMEDEEVSRPKDANEPSQTVLPDGPPNDSHRVGMTRPRTDTDLPLENDAGRIQKKQRVPSVQFDLDGDSNDKMTDA